METVPEDSQENNREDAKIQDGETNEKDKNENMMKRREEEQTAATTSQQSSDGLNEPESSLISQRASEDKPSSNFAMAIIVSLICPGACMCGIAALMFGFKVRSELNHGDIDAARRSSKVGKLLISVGYITTTILLGAALVASVIYEVYRLIYVWVSG